MSSAPSPSSFSRRVIGRASSPPTWACYEQIHYDSCSDSCSEDDEDYPHEQSDNDHSSDSEDERSSGSNDQGNGAHDIDSMDMEVDEGENPEPVKKKITTDAKGKQKAMEPTREPSRTKPRKSKEHVYQLRPILTIHRSQGFVWNQDLFIPPYIKDRYVASTSPPNAHGFISTSTSSTNSVLNEYEVEVVEIKVQEGELDSYLC